MGSVTGKSKDNYAATVRLKSIGVMVVLILLAVICLLPIYILAVNATRTSTDIINNGVQLIPGKYLIANIKETSHLNEIGQIHYSAIRGYLNSGIITVVATFFSVFFSSLTAYGLVVYDFKASTAAYTMILAVMMVPVQVTSVGFVNFMAQLKLTDTYWPLVLPAIAAPPIVFYMRQYMKSSFPLDIVEAARIDGSAEFRTFLTIGIPLMKPAIGVQAIFAFIANWNNFYTPSMILISRNEKQLTMPMMVQSILTNDKLSDMGVRYTSIFLSIVPVIIVYCLLSRTIVDGVAEGGVKE
ncbi:MAG: carbohydrate ABC transporter permease [Oscillospiraceae bacterium]|nr:carbohydrate ABC transporter permease [Oscillospiraceae bacterium]